MSLPLNHAREYSRLVVSQFATECVAASFISPYLARTLRTLAQARWDRERDQFNERGEVERGY
jgi:hypothetical protein